MKQALGIYPLKTLCQQPLLPIPYVVDGLLAPGLYLLGGSPKVGKSWMALQLCLAVCRGVPFLGRQTRQSEVRRWRSHESPGGAFEPSARSAQQMPRVIFARQGQYLALEDGPQRLHARAVRLCQAEVPAGLYLCEQAPCIGQGLEDGLRRTLDERPGVRLIIIDTLQKVRAPQQYGATYGGDYQDIAALKALADERQICLLVIHHLRKMGDADPVNRLPGTNGLSGAADGILILAREKRQEGTATLTAAGRDIEDVEEQLQFIDCRWCPVTAENRLRMDALLGPLQTLLRQNGAFSGTATELADMLEQQGQAAAPAALSKYIRTHAEWLAQAGILVETRRTNQKRTLLLRQCPEQGRDEDDGNDRSDSARGEGTAPASPSQLSQPSSLSQTA